MLEKLFKFLIFSFVFLPEYRIFNIPIPVITLIFSLIIFLIYQKTNTVRRIFKKDKIKGVLFLIMLLTIATYFLNAGNAENVTQINYFNTGQKPDNLYLKMAINGILLIVIVMLAFSMGLAYNGKEPIIRRAIKFIINLITVNAIINIIAWAIQTGGVIGRYNFNLPIISSFGINIQWSILGFILQLSMIKGIRKETLETVKLFVLFFSILIIISRENQLIFIIIFILYQFLSIRRVRRPIMIIYILAFLVSAAYFAQSIFNSTFIHTYQAMLNPQGDDLLVRYNNILSALNIFKHYVILGIGYGMFAGYNKVAVSITGVNLYLGSVHNGIISVITEMGLIGLIVNFVLVYGIVHRMNNIRKMKGRIIKYVTAIFVFIFVNIFASLISNYILLPPPSEYSYYGLAFISWLLIGIMISFEKNSEIKDVQIV